MVLAFDRFTLPLGSCLFGIPVRLHWSFLVLLLVQSLAALPAGKWWALLWFLVLGPVLLFTILVHELGHCLAARSIGGKAEGILLWPLGGLAFIHHTASPKADMWVAVAGPLTHLPMLLLWVGLSAAATQATYGRAFVTLNVPYPDPQHLGVALCSMAIIMNITLFLFNLLIPAYPLDGGRILVDSLLACGVRPVPAAKVTLGVAIPIAAGMLIYGAVMVQVTTILISIFIFWACFQLFDALRKGQLETHPLFAYTAGQQQGGAGATPAVEAGYFAGTQPGYPAAAPGQPAYPAAAPAPGRPF